MVFFHYVEDKYDKQQLILGTYCNYCENMQNLDRELGLNTNLMGIMES